MATTIGNEYEHIDFTHNNITTRHPIKDATARSMVGDIVKISDSDPQLPNNKIWIKETPNAEVQVPTYEEFEEVKAYAYRNKNLIDPAKASSGISDYIPIDSETRYVLTHKDRGSGNFSFTLYTYDANKANMQMSFIELTAGEYEKFLTFNTGRAYLKITVSSAPDSIDRTDISRVYLGKFSDGQSFVPYHYSVDEQIDNRGYYTKPVSGIPGSDIASGVIPVLTDLIDDTAGVGDSTKVWSADKSATEHNTLLSALNQQTTDVEILHITGANTIQPKASEYINYNISRGQIGQPNSARATGPYIYLPVNAKAVWGVASGYAFTATCQYDRYHNYIGQYATLHANARYMRFCIRKDDNTNISPAEAAAAFSFSLTYESDNIKKAMGKNLLDQTKAVNGYISNNAGAITTAGAAYHTSDYIPIASGQKITISPSVRIFLAFDTSKSPITESYMNTETDNYTYTSTADGYVRFSYRDQNADITQAEYGATVTPYAPYQTEVEPDIHLNEAMRSDVQGIIGGESITGKKFLLFGDSIMHGAGNSNYGIGDILQEKYAMSFWDYCESGALVEYKEGRTQTPVYQQIANAITAGRSPDFIIMDGLSNDINAGTLGEMSADFDYVTHGYNTFGAALEYCFGQLRTSYPEIPVLYVIPHSSNARDYALELQFGNLAREICKKWSVPIADVYRDGNMTARIPAQLQAFTYYPTETSGTHPNRAGYDFAYMPLIISWLKNVYANID